MSPTLSELAEVIASAVQLRKERDAATARAEAAEKALREIAENFGWIDGTEGEIACERCRGWRRGTVNYEHAADCPVRIAHEALAAAAPPRDGK